MKRAVVASVIVSMLAVSGCKTPDPQTATIIAQPTTPVTKNMTSFSHALRCMDDLFLAYGKRGITITSDGLPDRTETINSGTKDMMITTLSRMSEKSEAFRFIDIETAGSVYFIQDRARRNFDLPNYYIRGAITQVDRNVASDSKSGGVAIPFASLGYSADQLLSVVTIDMNIGKVITREIMPGMHTTNTITLVGGGKGLDSEGIIKKASVFLEISQDRSQGTHQAVRTLVELGLIEVLGKLTKVPYWKCLQIESTDPTMIQQARDWYDQIPATERIRIIQQAMHLSRLYTGPVDGTVNPQFREAIDHYKARQDLIANGKVDFDLYYRLLVDNAAVMPHPNGNENSDGTAAPAAYTSLAPGKGASITEALGTGIGLTLEPVGGKQAKYRLGDQLSFNISVNRTAEVYCYYEFEEDGVDRLARVFPNRFQPDPVIRPGQSVRFPAEDAGFQIELSTPGATEALACVAKEGGYARGQAPIILTEPDLTPIANIPTAQLAVGRHLQADSLTTDAKSLLWLVN